MNKCRWGIDTSSEMRNVLQRALELARHNKETGGMPFAAIVIYQGKSLVEAVNSCHISNDPTNHAEMMAIRTACRLLGRPNLSECDFYTVAYPCPMCLAALLMAKPQRLVFAISPNDKERLGLGTAAGIYAELQKDWRERGIETYHLAEVEEDAFSIFYSKKL